MRINKTFKKKTKMIVKELKQLKSLNKFVTLKNDSIVLKITNINNLNLYKNKVP